MNFCDHLTDYRTESAMYFLIVALVSEIFSKNGFFTVIYNLSITMIGGYKYDPLKANCGLPKMGPIHFISLIMIVIGGWLEYLGLTMFIIAIKPKNPKQALAVKMTAWIFLIFVIYILEF